MCVCVLMCARARGRVCIYMLHLSRFGPTNSKLIEHSRMPVSTSSAVATLLCAVACIWSSADLPSVTLTVGRRDGGAFSHGYRLTGLDAPDAVTMEGGSGCSCHCECPQPRPCFELGVFGSWIQSLGAPSALVTWIAAGLVWLAGACAGCCCAYGRTAHRGPAGRMVGLAGDDGALAARGVVVRRR